MSLKYQINPSFSKEQLQTYILDGQNAKESEQFRAPIFSDSKLFSKDYSELFSPSRLKNTKNPYLHMYEETTENPRAVTICVHGLDSHINRNSQIAYFLIEKKIATVGFDFQGFGKSQGLKALVNDYKEYVQDICDFIDFTSERYPNIPIFIIGQSMGPLLSMQAVIKKKNKKDIRGCVFFNPAFGLHQNFQTIVKYAVKYILQYIIPTVILSGSGKNIASRNPEVIDSCKKDVYYNKAGNRPRTIGGLFEQMDSAENYFGLFDVPCLVVQGGHDKIVDIKQSYKFWQETKNQDKTLLFIDEAWHNLLAEPEIEFVLEYLTKWIDERIEL